MENQHQKTKGYRDLSQTEIDLINEIKEKGTELQALFDKVSAHLNAQTVAAINAEQNRDYSETTRLDEAQPHRWVSIARTDFQTGLMALTRAVAQPTSF